MKLEKSITSPPPEMDIMTLDCAVSAAFRLLQESLTFHGQALMKANQREK